MKITILTLFPSMVSPFFENSIMKRAVDKGIIEYSIINFRDFASGVHKKTDDTLYGGGKGLLLMPEPLFKALDSIDAKSKRVIFPTPSGKLLNEDLSKELSKEKELVFICGHYEGVDQRVIDQYVDDEISIGDYVISSGEVATLVIIDSLYRLIDGVIAKESLEEESFEGGLLEYPQYTHPSSYCSKNVPSVLLTGHALQIAQWRASARLEKTLLNRPELLTDAPLSVNERKMMLKNLEKRNI